MTRAQIALAALTGLLLICATVLFVTGTVTPYAEAFASTGLFGVVFLVGLIVFESFRA